MDPIEYTDAVLQMQTNKILQENKEYYTQEEVMKIIQEMAHQQRKAIFNGEFILDINFISDEKATIKDEEYSIKKMLVDNDKYVIFLQTESGNVEDIRNAVPEILKVSNNILGVFIVSSKADINLVTAKLSTAYDTSDYEFVSDDLDTFNLFSQDFVDKIHDSIKNGSGFMFKKNPLDTYYTTRTNNSTSSGSYLSNRTWSK